MGSPRVAAIAIAFAVLAAACGADGDDGGQQVVGGDEPMVPVTDRWVEAPPGPLADRDAVELIVGGPGSTSLYVFGLRRLFGEHGDRYETEASFHAYDAATGEWRELASPPIVEELVRAHGVATADSVYVTLSDCEPAPPPTGFVGPSGCTDKSNTLRGLRFDLTTEEWSEWPLSTPMSEVGGRLVRGFYPPDGTLYFSADRAVPPSDNRGVVHAYRQASETWSEVSVNYASVCTDGDRLYGFEGPGTATVLEALAATFDPSAGVDPALHEIEVPWVEADPTGIQSSEHVTVSYADHMANPGREAYGIQASCSANGAVIVPQPRALRSSLVLPWLRRAAGREWVQVQPPASGGEFVWTPRAAISDRVFVTGTNTGVDPPEYRLLELDPATGAVAELPDPGSFTEYGVIGDSVLMQTGEGRGSGQNVRLLALDG